jgi:MerR family transcriptional regulator, thiopeptide resistance regulator
VSNEYSVGKLAELAGVTIRTLHHYDEIGLLRPTARTSANYRVYGAADVERLQQILLYRRLGFGLDEIAALVDDPDVDAVAHLRRQRDLLVGRGSEIAAMIAAIDTQLEARRMGMRLTPAEQLEMFGTDKIGGEWADEAAQRWGETDAYRQSARRTAKYSKQDWIQIRAEGEEGLRAFAEAMQSQHPATGPEAMAVAERHREYISRWFYDCSYAIHQGLAELYLADARFRKTYDRVADGLAQYVHDAIIANAAAAT